MIKSLQISTVYGGGAGRACIRLHEALLTRSDIISKVLTTQIPPPEAKNVYRLSNSELELFLRRRWTKLIAARALWGKPSTQETFCMPRTGYAVHKHPLIAEVDLLNLHWTTKMLDHSSFFAAVNKPIVWTLHDMNPWSGGYPYDLGFPMEEYQSVIEANLALQTKSLQHISNMTIVCPSRWLYDLSRQSKLFGRFRHELIPYSLDLAVFKPYEKLAAKQQFALPRDKKVILFVASHLQLRRKGLHHLVKALSFLKEEADLEHFCLAIVGGGKINALPQGLQVIEIGRINNKDRLAQVYSAADIFVIPSEQDNLPNTVLESLACGTPVVGFEVGGIVDMVNEPALGRLGAKLDPQALKRAIKDALLDEFDQAYIRQSAVKRYSHSIQASAYYSLYQEMLNNVH
ncbi:MAG: glycosyltransferase [Bacteroidota bacterium]